MRVISYDVLTKKKYEICAFIGYYAPKSSNSLPSFWDSLLVPSSSVKKLEIYLLLKMGPIGCQEMLVRNYHSTLLNIPEECWSHVHCNRSLKSCKKKIIYLYSEKFTKSEVWQTNDNLTHCQPDDPLIKYPHFPYILHTSNVQGLIIFLLKIWLFTWYSWTQYWRNCIERERERESVADPNGKLFLKPRPFVKRNTGFTNVPSFTSLLMCSMYFTLSCRTLLFVLPTSNNSVQFVFGEIPGVCLGCPV